uniref:Uncharacterized protein n=1 Tax=Cacopsylla melanoneura TaxID=428564 RepID=A0A8D8YLS7_9HEMI
MLLSSCVSLGRRQQDTTKHGEKKKGALSCIIRRYFGFELIFSYVIRTLQNYDSVYVYRYLRPSSPVVQHFQQITGNSEKLCCVVVPYIPGVQYKHFIFNPVHCVIVNHGRHEQKL